MPARSPLEPLAGKPMQSIFTNARLVTPNGVVDGTLAVVDGIIAAVDRGASRLASADDLGGDILAPGFIECHTDNLERHFLPRPHVLWPDPLAAALTHDAQIAAAGITTVYDALSAGFYDSTKAYRKQLFADMVEAVGRGAREGLFRVDHRLHLRCELSDPELISEIEGHLDNPLLRLASLMDHTPGQRQWRDMTTLRNFLTGQGTPADEADAMLAERIARAVGAVDGNWRRIVELLRSRGIPIASHDDTTLAHVADAVRSGCSICEFPTTIEAARAAKQAGMATVAGAPNVVRGGSHSGGVSVRELAEAGVLDVMSSDYVPSSLLQAAVRLWRDRGAGDRTLGLHEAIAFITARPAAMLGLADRGRLVEGLRADLVQFRLVGETPLVVRVFRGGIRIF